jgi:hypothetical protein
MLIQVEVITAEIKISNKKRNLLMSRLSEVETIRGNINKGNFTLRSL